MSHSNNDVGTLDLYCLECGYNLRGQAGSPRRCPECGYSNRVEDLEVPAKLIRKALKRLESGAALCGASAATMLLFVVPLLIVMAQPTTQTPMFAWRIVESVGGGAVIFYVVGMFQFRRSCEGKLDWFPTLLWFTVLACLISAAGLAAIVAIIWGIVIVVTVWPASPLNLQVGARIVVAITMLAISTWLYRVAKRAIHPLQRKTAARFARAHFYKK